MISLPLKFDEVESVEEFVNMVKRLDYDVDVKIGRCVFDAKSLMSVPDDRRKTRIAVVEAHTNDNRKHLKRNLRINHSVRKKVGKALCVRCIGVFFDARKKRVKYLAGETCTW